jgi:hypothetical protein
MNLEQTLLAISNSEEQISASGLSRRIPAKARLSENIDLAASPAPANCFRLESIVPR